MSTVTVSQHNYRIDSIDLLRGLVMVIMALDHTREYFHNGALTADPLNLQTTTPLLFFTRWITHFCAPVFVFLSGTSIYLQGLRKRKGQLTAFLIKRGLWLIVVELVLITLALTFDVSYGFIILQVIWAIGISMVLLALLQWLPFGVLLLIGLLIVCGHNGFDAFEKQNADNIGVGYRLLKMQSVVPIGNNRVLAMLYPFLPWTGIMIVGYCFGRLYHHTNPQRVKQIALLGGAVVLAFVVLRYFNVYGDPRPWSAQSRPLYPVLSFLNTQKYPPSLLFTCMTLGPALLFLAAFDSVRTKTGNFLVTFGRVPFFYFILHLYLLHLASAILFLLSGHSWAEGIAGIPGIPFRFLVPGEGLSLLGTYGVWVALVILFYLPCRWFWNYKQRHRSWWLSYL